MFGMFLHLIAALVMVGFRTLLTGSRLLSYTNTNHISRTAFRSMSLLSTTLPTLPTKKTSSTRSTLMKRLESNDGIIEAELANNNIEREDLFRLTRASSKNAQELIQQVLAGDLEAAKSLLHDSRQNLDELIAKVGANSIQRESRLSSHFERFGTGFLLLGFFETGRLLSPLQTPLCNDEEYITATICCAQELSRYALHRGSNADVTSVEIVRCLLTELFQLLLAFNFRNGPLRRRFDGLKYHVKSVEDIAFELSLLEDVGSKSLFQDSVPATNANAVGAGIDNGATADAAAVSSVTWRFVDADAINAIQERLSEKDALRETVIKETRDIQKLSKQAIFSIIRGQHTDAQNKLSTASVIIDRVSTLIASTPTLRAGSFSNSLEEWCEARMLLDWCREKTVPAMADLPHQLTAWEYLGGLSDFTGELGRLAVRLAANKDFAAVQEIAEADALIYEYMAKTNNSAVLNLDKKLEAVQSNLRKVEDLVFELSLLQRSGRVKRMRLNNDESGAAVSSKVDEEN